MRGLQHHRQHGRMHGIKPDRNREPPVQDREVGRARTRLCGEVRRAEHEITDRNIRDAIAKRVDGA